jgi:pteridine reductase
MIKANSIALVTGGAQRIGAEIVRHLHNTGFDIALHYNSSAKQADELSHDLNTQRQNSARSFQADLSNSDGAITLAKQVLEHWGHLDLLINNASSFYPITTGATTEQDWDNLMGSNLKGAFFLTEALIETLKNRRGSVINIIDIHGERPLKNYTLYGMAKAGLAMMTKSFAKELAPEVRVNGISPGAILWPDADTTELNTKIKQRILARVPLQRPGEPEDIAKTVVFLAKGAPYITGQIISVDGGRLLNT